MDNRDVIDGRWKVKGELDYSGAPRRETWADFWLWLWKIVAFAISAGVVILISMMAHAIIDAAWPR